MFYTYAFLVDKNTIKFQAPVQELLKFELANFFLAKTILDTMIQSSLITHIHASNRCVHMVSSSNWSPGRRRDGYTSLWLYHENVRASDMFLHGFSTFDRERSMFHQSFISLPLSLTQPVLVSLGGQLTFSDWKDHWEDEDKSQGNPIQLRLDRERERWLISKAIQIEEREPRVTNGSRIQSSCSEGGLVMDHPMTGAWQGFPPASQPARSHPGLKRGAWVVDPRPPLHPTCRFDYHWIGLCCVGFRPKFSF